MYSINTVYFPTWNILNLLKIQSEVKYDKSNYTHKYLPKQTYNHRSFYSFFNFFFFFIVLNISGNKTNSQNADLKISFEKRIKNLYSIKF